MTPSSHVNVLLAMAFAILVGGTVGCGQRHPPRPLAKGATLEVYLITAANTPNARTATDPDSGAVIYLAPTPIISSTDVTTVQRSDPSSEDPWLTISLTPAGSTKLAAATTPTAGQKLAVVANGKVIAVANVLQPIVKDCRITSGFIHKNEQQVFDALTKN